ncbi:phosphoethanolamine transferase [Crenobacter intestini]|uniref:Phosphoethanolamine--lipid A transferase n=1 Tax=Crenobacter intestini TaxID=2563443 RepID=A0A4T0UJA0_9NEIS|nr:phosphoethanolamine--lipid A transferase [Crenobacter intestini]TIC78654.1 phosphoethanolamine--lipid A transferase [Crenobacter intestini]
MFKPFAATLTRPWRAEYLAPLLALTFVVFFNLPFWQSMHEITAADPAGAWQTLLLAFLLVTAFFTLVLQLLLWPWLFRPLVALLFVGAAGAQYFMRQYGVLIDANMIQNVFQTDPAEVRDLMTGKMAAALLLLGVLPAVLLFRLPVAFRSPLRELGVRLLAIVVSAVVLVGVALAGYQDLSSLMRNHRQLRFELVPLNFIQGTRSYLKQHFATPTVIEPIGLDARQHMAGTANGKKNVLVLVVGETARADRFSLGGYARPTNPELAKLGDLAYFRNVWSCGTETAVSLPCMFSGMGRDEYDATQARSQQNLLDVLQHAKLDVQWVNNNSGCKGVCVRLPVDDRSKWQDARWCESGECYDEVMLESLAARLSAFKGDGVLVLHQKGSHGPAYYKRYPAAFETFQPVCRTSELQKCDEASIGNAYDNTIRYTDHFLAQAIRQLAAAQDVNTALVYVSDHGESLGEGNLYLHGTPYALAPDAQKHVPMLAWLSPGFQQASGVSTACLQGKTGEQLSHDNLFHSVLGLMGVSTSLYQAPLDIGASCRQGGRRG